jgi:hypothetical protein
MGSRYMRRFNYDREALQTAAVLLLMSVMLIIAGCLALGAARGESTSRLPPQGPPIEEEPVCLPKHRRLLVAPLASVKPARSGADSPSSVVGRSFYRPLQVVSPGGYRVPVIRGEPGFRVTPLTYTPLSYTPAPGIPYLTPRAVAPAPVSYSQVRCST